MWREIFTSTRKKKLTLRGLDNQDGQVAIFIALIFQILFVLFAMLINVSLIVHDKINLQNSVDLAAYYGAERQAELLNEIAHINYQIRQEYKLLSWRQRILGTFTFHSNTYNIQYAPQAPPEDDLHMETTMPAVCVDHSGWMEVYNKDPSHVVSYCQSPHEQKPGIPKYNAVAVFLPINTMLEGYYTQVANTISLLCKEFGPMDWFNASLWLLEYKQNVKMRSDAIRALAVRLSQQGKNAAFVDIYGSSIYSGVLKTYLKNLTESNRTSVASKNTASIDNPADFTFINGLSADVGSQCAQVVNDAPYWLHENQIWPIVTYVDSTESGSAACSGSVQAVSHTPYSLPASSFNAYPINQALVDNDAGEPAPGVHTYPYSSLGYEKNPWCMAYVGVKATTRPRKPFAPFGKPVTLVARSFASPFGGRIGPWDQSQWPPNSDRSTGGQRLDPLAVPRTEEAKAGVELTPPLVATDNINSPIPNYSRYPGDKYGLTSGLEHYFYMQKFFAFHIPNSSVPATNTLPQQSYIHLGDPNNTEALADVKVNTALRIMEESAIAPDLFDITYYSIDPDFYTLYQPSNGILGDVGQNPSGPNYNIHNQMVQAAKNLLNPPAITGVNWLVPNLDYLLTGWTQGRTGDYTSSPPQFATCTAHPNYSQAWPPTTGFCVAGGRTGYSVRIVARKYLQSSNGSLELGGPGVTGKLLNPLPSGW